MTPDAKAENIACQGVVEEFRAMLVQKGMPAPIIKLCKELETRIELRRLLDLDTNDSIDAGDVHLSQGNGGQDGS